MKIFKKLRKVLVVAGSIAALAFGAASFASADDTGGGIGGGGGNTGNTNQRWVSIAYDEPGVAWDVFRNQGLSGYGSHTVDREVRNRVVGGVSVCEASRVIWFLQSSSGWSYNYHGYTHGSRWSSSRGTIESPQIVYGSRAPVVSETQKFFDWDRNSNGHLLDTSPGYTIICNGAFDPPIPGPIYSWTSTSSVTSSDSFLTWTHPYQWRTDVEPQIMVNGRDPIGENNLHVQAGRYVKTNFGQLWDNLTRHLNSGVTPSGIDALVREAVNKDRNLDRAKINLDSANRAGMAEGGVLNVYERTMYGTITATSTTYTTTIRTCQTIQEWNSSINAYGPPRNVPGSCNTVSVPSGSAITAVKNVSSYQNTGFYQMLSVHCNPAGVAALRNADANLRTLHVGDGTNAISAYLYTRKYDQQPQRLDFGDRNNPNAAKAATGSLGFYDKECGFQCTADPSASSGATTQNGALLNTRNGGTLVDGGRYGVVATADGTNNNRFEFFRDNTPKQLRMDVWYPISSGLVNYNGAAAISTTVVRDSNGTPDVNTSSGGKFTMKSGNTNLFTGNRATAEQKNWNRGEFSNKTGTLLRGLHRDFTVQGSWASEENRPNILNVKWEYAPTVSTRFHATGVGFGVGGSQTMGTVVTASTNIEGKCYANFGTNSQMLTTQLFNNNTGTGTVNNLDTGILQPVTHFPETRQTNLVVKFVRSTTE